MRTTPRRWLLPLRVWRRLRALLGGLLLTAAATTGMATVILPALALVGLGSAGEDGLSAEDRAALRLLGKAELLVVAITLTGWLTGRHLLRGRRHMVLWLRRFRYEDASRVVSAALDHIGHTWRVVTLDDVTAQPVGVAAGLRWSAQLLTAVHRVGPKVLRALARTGWLAARVCLVGLVGVAAWTAVYGDLPALLSALPGGSEPPRTREQRLAWALVVVLVALFVLLLAYLVVSLAALPLLGLFLLVGSVSSQVLGTESAMFRVVRTSDDVRDVVASVAVASSQRLAPRLTVLEVEGTVWQQTVASLARRSSAVLVDVSHVTENLLWEVREVLRLLPARTVLVGRHDLVERLAGGAPTDLDDVPAQQVVALRELLDGREVVAYRTTLLGRVRFQRALLAELEHAAPRRRWTARDVGQGLLVLVGIAAFAAAVREAVLLVASWT